MITATGLLYLSLCSRLRSVELTILLPQQDLLRPLVGVQLIYTESHDPAADAAVRVFDGVQESHQRFPVRKHATAAATPTMMTAVFPMKNPAAATRAKNPISAYLSNLISSHF